MGHYASEMMSGDELDRRMAEAAEASSWQAAGFSSYSHHHGALVCPIAGCVIARDYPGEESLWRKHLKWHNSLEQAASMSQVIG